MGKELKEEILSLMEEHPGVKSPELKEAYIEDLRLAFISMSRRPGEMPGRNSHISKQDIRKYEFTYFKWQKKLVDLRELLRSGQTTGDPLTDYALIKHETKQEVIDEISYLQALQERVTGYVDEEILVTALEHGMFGCDTYGQGFTHYDSKAYKLAKIRSGELIVELGKCHLDLPQVYFNTGGYAYYTTDVYAIPHRSTFFPENLKTPLPKESITIGTNGIQIWRDESDYHQYIYKMLSATPRPNN